MYTRYLDPIDEALARCLSARERIPRFVMDNPVFSACFEQWLGRVKPLALALAALAAEETDGSGRDRAAPDLCAEIDRAFLDLDRMIDLVCRVSVEEKAVDRGVYCMI